MSELPSETCKTCGTTLLLGTGGRCHGCGESFDLGALLERLRHAKDNNAVRLDLPAARVPR